MADAAGLSRAGSRPSLTDAGADKQCIKEGSDRMDRLSCRSVAGNAVRLQLHALAYFMRPQVLPGSGTVVPDEFEGRS
jgi:hypothetical protein